MLSRSGVIQKESLTERMPPRKLRRPAKLVDDREKQEEEGEEQGQERRGN